MVERYQQQVRSRPAAQQDLNVRPTAEAFGAGVGRGLQQLGNGIGNAADALAFRNNLQAENDARDATNRYRELARQIRYDPQTGYLNQTGTNALDNRARYEEQLAKAREQASKNLSPQARREYDRLSQSIEDGAREEFIRHNSSQLRAVTVAEGQATVAGFVDEALLNYNNPDQFNSFLTQAIQEQNRLFALTGVSGEAAAEARRELVSGVHAAVAARMADEGAGGATRANAYINSVREQLTAEDRMRLDSVVRPLLRRDLARTWVDGNVQGGGRPVDNYVRNGGAAAGVTPAQRFQEIHDLTTDAYARNTRSRESGREAGRLDAIPRTRSGDVLSTARGPYQFIEETWLSMVNRLRAQGGARWADGLSRDEILEMRWTGGTMRDRPDLVTAANDEVFTEFRRYNRNLLTNAGFAASPENEYMMHFFGERGGLAVLRASPGARMESVIGDRAARINGIRELGKLENGLVGVTVGAVRSALSRAYGSPTEPVSNGGDHDFAHLYRQAMSIEDPDQRAAVLEELDTRRQIFERANAIERQETFDQLYRDAHETNRWELSATDAIRLGAEGSAAFRNAAQNALAGIKYTDPVVYSDIKDLAVNDPEAFILRDFSFELSENLLDDRTYSEIRDLQRAVRAQLDNKEGEAQAALDNNNVFTAFTQVANLYKDVLGYDPTDAKTPERRKQVANFREQLRLAMAEYTMANGAEPGQAALQQIAFALLTGVTLQQSSWSLTGGYSSTTDSYLFDMDRIRQPGVDIRLTPTTYNDIPATVRDGLDAMIAGFYGTDGPLEEQHRRVELAYQIQQIAGGPEALRGLEPDIEIRDIMADPDIASVVSVETVRNSRGRSGAGRTTTYTVDLPDGTTEVLSEDQFRSLYIRMMMERLREAGLIP